MIRYVELNHITGTTKTTKDTVALFNSVREIENDDTGIYMYLALRPEKTGVIVTRIDLN